MKKLILLVLTISGISFAHAGDRIDMEKQQINCGSYAINSKTTASELVKNCPVDNVSTHNYLMDKGTTVKFKSTITSTLECTYNGEKLYKCEMDN